MIVTVKKSKKSVTICAFVGILVVAAWLLVPVTLAAAETVNFKAAVFFTKMEETQVGGVEQHTIGMYEQKGVCFFENGEVATVMTWGTWDAIVGVQLYAVLTFEDGSTQWLKGLGIPKPTEDPYITLYEEGPFEYIKGTGRFEGIKGTGSMSGKQFVLLGLAYFEGTGSYTLPSQ